MLVVAICGSASAAGLGSAAAQDAQDDDGSAPVTAAELNLLHGLFCDPQNTDWCNAPGRVGVLGKWLERADCPDLVGLQEINERLEELLGELVAEICDGEYAIHFEDVNSPDRQMILTRLDVVEEGYLDIANFPWEAFWVRVDSPQGPIDFLTAHFASSANDPPCTAEICPPVCAPGITTNECHAHEVVEFFAARPDPAALSIVTGDLNARPDEPTVEALLDGGFIDVWLDAGRPECDPDTGKGCTGHCDEPDATLIGLDTRKGLACDGRIDFVMARPSAGCALETTAKGFAHKPLRKRVDGMYWSSDHKGVQASLRCGV
jgi:endonuclease/exonuclease/phosphatase family metal-dependent hydrolase